MRKKPDKRRFLILAERVCLLMLIGFVGQLWFSTKRNEGREQPSTAQGDIYVRIPWRSGAIDLDPHWRTTFAELGLDNIESLEHLPTAPSALNPWGTRPPRAASSIFLIPDDLSDAWSISVGHGFVQVLIGKTIFLYYDAIGLEELLLRQGIVAGYLTDMQKIFPERDFTNLKPPNIAKG